MSNLTGWSNLESFLTSTTPVVPSHCSFSKLISAFKLPSAFGVEVKLTEDEIIYFQPTLSAIKLPTQSYYESRPPHCRPLLYKFLQESFSDSQIDENSWMSILWIPINKLPPGRAYGSILVYYKLQSEIEGCLPISGLVLFKIPSKWVNVYKSTGEPDYDLTSHWERIRTKLIKQAYDLQNEMECLHHDFNFIVSRDKNNLII